MPRPVQLVLGTAQLGLPYGKVNASQPPADDAARDILETALAAGFTILDTARAYGAAEERIGAWLRSSRHRPGIITKCRPLLSGEDGALLASEVVGSLENLGLVVVG